MENENEKELDKMGTLASAGGGCLYIFFCLHHLDFLLQFFQNFVADFAVRGSGVLPTFRILCPQMQCLSRKVDGLQVHIILR